MQVVQPVIVPIESLLVDLGYVQQARDALHDFAQAPVALFVFRRQFFRRMAILRHYQLYGLGERFVSLGQPLQSLV
jgi:hypothetical protein